MTIIFLFLLNLNTIKLDLKEIRLLKGNVMADKPSASPPAGYMATRAANNRGNNVYMWGNVPSPFGDCTLRRCPPEAVIKPERVATSPSVQKPFEDVPYEIFENTVARIKNPSVDGGEKIWGIQTALMSLEEHKKHVDSSRLPPLFRDKKILAKTVSDIANTYMDTHSSAVHQLIQKQQRGIAFTKEDFNNNVVVVGHMIDIADFVEQSGLMGANGAKLLANRMGFNDLDAVIKLNEALLNSTRQNYKFGKPLSYHEGQINLAGLAGALAPHAAADVAPKPRPMPRV